MLFYVQSQISPSPYYMPRNKLPHFHIFTHCVLDLISYKKDGSSSNNNNNNHLKNRTKTASLV